MHGAHPVVWNKVCIDTVSMEIMSARREQGRTGSQQPGFVPAAQSSETSVLGPVLSIGVALVPGGGDAASAMGLIDSVIHREKLTALAEIQWGALVFKLEVGEFLAASVRRAIRELVDGFRAGEGCV